MNKAMFYFKSIMFIVFIKTVLSQKNSTNQTSNYSEEMEAVLQIYGFTIKNCTETLDGTYLELMQKLNKVQRSKGQFLVPQSLLRSCVMTSDFDNKIWPDTVDIKISNSGVITFLKRPSQLGIVFEELIDLTFNGDILIKTMFVLEWLDLRLRWLNETPFSNWRFHNSLSVPSIELYSLPILRLENCHLESCEIKADETSLARIGRNGHVRLTFERQVQATCDEDMTYFPFDTQECVFQFKTLEVNFEFLNKSSVIHALFTENPEWFISKVKYYVGECSRYPVILINISGEYNYTQYNYTNYTQYIQKSGRKWHGVNICLNMKVTAIRMTNFYWSNLLIPLLVVVFVSILTIVYPSGSDEKVNVLVTLLLSYVMFQSTLSNIMPKTRSDPLILSYIIIKMGLCALSLLFTFVTMYIKQLEDSVCRPPRLLQCVLTSWDHIKMQFWKRQCCLRDKYSEAAENKNMLLVSENGTPSSVRTNHLLQTDDDQENAKKSSDGWEALADLLNIIFNLIFIALNIIVFNIYMLPLLLQWIQNSYAPSYFGNYEGNESKP